MTVVTLVGWSGKYSYGVIGNLVVKRSCCGSSTTDVGTPEWHGGGSWKEGRDKSKFGEGIMNEVPQRREGEMASNNLMEGGRDWG